MTKKVYRKPSIRMSEMMVEEPLTQASAPTIGIQYGGVDTEGEKDPESRLWTTEHKSVWDD